MKNTIKTIGIALVWAIGTLLSNAQPVPCPDCPPCTNCPPYTNAPFIPTEFPTNALLVRQAQISTAGTIIYAGNPWVLDTNNLLIYGGGNWSNAPTSSSWTYVLAITNTSPNLLYSLEYRSDLATSGTNVGPYFVGATNGAEIFVTNTVNNVSISGFWLAHQQPGFVAYGHAAKKPQGMGIYTGPCPGFWSGFIDFTNGPVGGQYRVDTNYLTHTFVDFQRSTNKMQAWGGPFFNCDEGSVSLGNTNTAYTAWTRVFIYLSADWPSNQDYPILLQGFQSP